MTALPKQELRQLVADACTDEALQQLLELLAGLPKYSKTYNAMNLLCGQWQELDENSRLNLLSFKEASTHRARINAAVLAYLDELPDEIAPPKSKTPAPEALLRQNVQAIAADTAWEYDLFFSFSSKDLEAARTFCHALRGHGLRVFFSADDLRLRGGQSFGAVITQALSRSRHFLLFCSPNAMQSEWVMLESDTFFQQYHLNDKSRRSFQIAEGPDFQDDLVPVFYRRYQRVRDAEVLLHTLTAFAHAAEPQILPQLPDPNPNRDKLSESSPQATTPAEEHAWEFTTDADNRAAYERFRARFPQGFYTPEAQARLDAFGADDTTWEFATDNPNEKSLQKYLSKYPHGLHATEARDQIAALAAEALRAAREADPFHDLMIPIKGGTFEMGSNEYDDEKPPHKVTVPDFHLCKYLVTQAQWKQIMGNAPSHFKGDDLPVETVSWDDVQAFLKKLNEKLPAGQKHYRLSSEAEWEYAAKGGNQSEGFKYSGSNDLKEVGWYWENSGDKPLSGDWKSEEVTANNCKTHPVGQKTPNELGLYDMSGNVREWCQDVWHDDYKGAPGDGSAWEKGGDSTLRVVRGGSWYYYPIDCRAAYRDGGYAVVRYNDFGFRLAR